jgi:hypothetical protein
VSATTPDGKVWSIPKVNESVERLKQKRVLGADGAIAPAWCDPLTLEVIGRPDGAALAKAVHAAAPKSWREQNAYLHWRAGRSTMTSIWLVQCDSWRWPMTPRGSSG